MRHPRRSILGSYLLVLVLAAQFKPGLAQPVPSDSLPDPKLTPGDILPVTLKDICTPGYSKKVRDVPIAVKRAVFAEYGIEQPGPGEYEVDHLISLELGGSNSIRNLWPQAYMTSPWNARVKDKLENRLHALICSGQVDLATAQREIASDWIAAYKKYFHTELPPSARAEGSRPDSLGRPSQGSEGVRVWVNMHSGIFCYRGARWYGNTKHGMYMTEAQALKRGYRAARK